MRGRRPLWRNVLMLVAALTGLLVSIAGGAPAIAATDEIVNDPELEPADGAAIEPDVTADGNFVVYAVESYSPTYTRNIWAYDRGSVSHSRYLVNSPDQTVRGNGPASGPSISDDGNLVAYAAQDLASGEIGPNRTHVYLRDRRVGDSTIRLDGTDGDSHSPEVSGDGRYVVFNSTAQLVPQDLNGGYDVYRYTVATGAIELVSRGAATDASSAFPDVSEDGTKVVFTSIDALLPEDTHGANPTGSGYDVYVRDMTTGSLSLVTHHQDGDSGLTNGDLRISADGSTVVFTSSSSTIVPGDTNGQIDLFATTVASGATQRVTVWDDGSEGNEFAASPAVSGNGRYVSFESRANNWPNGSALGRVYVRDLVAQSTTLESIDNDGGILSSWGGRPTALSADSLLLLYTASLGGDLHGRQLTAGPPPASRVLTGVITVNSAPVSPGEQPGVLACPVGTSGASCPGGRFASTDAESGAFSVELADGVDYLVVAFIYQGGATSAPLVWNAADPDPSPVTMAIDFATVFGVVTAADGVIGNLGVGSCPAPQIWPGSCPQLKFDMAEGPTGVYTLRLPAGTYNMSGFAENGGVITQGMRRQLTFANNQSYNVDFHVDPSAARSLAGRVLVNGAPPQPLNAASVGACPLVNGLPAGCPFPQIAQADPNGNFLLPLEPGVDYAIVAFVAGVQTAPMTWHAASPDPSPAMFNIEYGTVQGTITAAAGVQGVLGVGACIAPNTWPCNPVYFTTGFNGSFSLRLPPGTYNTSGHARQLDQSIVLGARQQLTIAAGQTINQDYVVDPGSVSAEAVAAGSNPDMNGDGTADADQANVTAVSAATGGGFIAVESEAGDTVNEVSVVPAASAPVPPPSNAVFEDVLSFKIPVEAGGTRTVEVFFSEDIADGSTYVKLIDGVWQPFGTIDYGRDSVTLTLTDGGAGDADGAANGVIVDPGALARPSATAFFAPIDRNLVNVAKAGSAVPVKWNVAVGSVGVGAASTFSRISSSGAACTGGATDTVEAYSSGAGLQYLGNGNWQYDWKTQKDWAGHCRTLRLEVAGQIFTASFKFAK